MTVAAYAALDWPEPPDSYIGQLADVDRRAREAVVLVALADEPEPGTVVGGITYVDRTGPWATVEKGQVELRMLAVDPSAQGRGVGTSLVEACVERARLEGVHRITLHTSEWMGPARRIYERAGFERFPGHDEVVEGGICLYGYILRLQG